MPEGWRLIETNSEDCGKIQQFISPCGNTLDTREEAVKFMKDNDYGWRDVAVMRNGLRDSLSSSSSNSRSKIKEKQWVVGDASVPVGWKIATQDLLICDAVSYTHLPLPTNREV